MSVRNRVIMAVYPNAVGFGFAVVEGPREPLECGVVKISPITNAQTLKKIQDCLEYYEPILVILREVKGKGTMRFKRVRRLIRDIEAHALSKGLRVAKYSREDVRFVFKEFGAVSKYEIAKVIVKWLPQFKHRMPKYRKAWMAEDYNMTMFDAISLALTHFYMTD